MQPPDLPAHHRIHAMVSRMSIPGPRAGGSRPNPPSPRRWLARWLIGAAACALATACERPHRQARPPSASKPGGPLQIAAASFNLRYENSGDPGARSWRSRLVPVVRMVRKMDPDVMGVQEALHGQAADLWASLPDYGFYGVGRDDGERAGEYSGIFYRRDRFTADSSDCGTFWLSDRPNEPGSRTWGNVIPRVALWIYLTDNTTGRGCYVFNTHWDHQHQGSRERAAVLLAARIDTRKHPSDPVILLGDFNANESNPAVAWLRGAATKLPGARATWPGALTDTYQAIHPGEADRRTLHFWGASPKGTLKVDHILVSKGARVLTAEIQRDHDPMPSDHFPVSATVRWP